MESKLGDLMLPDYSRHMTKPKVIRLADLEIAMTQINLNQKRYKRNKSLKRKKIQLSQKVLQQNKHKNKTEILVQLVILEVMPVMDAI